MQFASSCISQRRLLLTAAALSLLLHAIVLLVLSPLFGRGVRPAAAQETVRISQISIVHLTPRAAPKPVQRTPPRHLVQHLAPHAAIAVPHRSHAVPPEARHVAAVTVHPAVHADAPAFASDTARYQATIAKLRANDDPVAAARGDAGTPAPAKEYRPNVAAEMGVQWSAGGVLEPVRSWKADGYQYYYVHYWVRYADGSTESGIVPWPLRYLPGADPFARGITHMPLPGPLPDFVLASGTTLQPLLAYCYEHHLALCPIEHD